MTPCQLRMARAAVDLSMRELGEELGLSAMAISRYERGDTKSVSTETAQRIKAWFVDRRIFFGPKEGVCVGQDVFAESRWIQAGCFRMMRMMKEAGITPRSSEMAEAAKKYREEE